jgi:alpha-galactosidase
MKSLFLAFLSCCISLTVSAQENHVMRISTDHADLIYKVGNDGRLYQSYLGKRLANDGDIKYLPTKNEAYIASGMEDYFEPAIHVLHNDGNPSLDLKYVSSSTQQTDGGQETTITLRDEIYPVKVCLHYIAYPKQDVIRTYTEICNGEKRPITLYKYASAMLHFDRAKYYLTEFSGDWAAETRMNELPLEFGKKILDTKLGSRANLHCSPFFELALDNKAQENTGEVLIGQLGWTGNFRFTFEVDNLHQLRLIAGINPYASDYQLAAGKTFRTPDFYFTYSAEGVGHASRNLHDWARQYQIKDGMGDRMTLLNNWETTYFDFNEKALESLMDDAKKLGVDMFLLDDGWFANKYPRKNDGQGLGDWTETKSKLPNGIGHLTETAKQKGVKFGLWIEPEMVNPKSELYEKHPDWVIHFANRKEYYYRNQLVLDLSNPKVQDYVFGIIDGLLTKYPDIAFFKWDCNSPITNIYSPYLKDRQSQLYVDHVRGLYNVMQRVSRKYPEQRMMLCSGGGGRSDFEALKYFTEFWPSDDTDPVERIYIQWGFSQVFPVKTLCSHVTSWNGASSIKFRTDVASMGKLGFDINVGQLSKDELTYCQQAIGNWNRLKPEILDGDQYRLVSPYDCNHSSTMYVDKGRDKAVVFAFDIHPRFSEALYPVLLQGLDPQKQYTVKEINLMPGKKSNLPENGKTFSGDYLMKAGLNLFGRNQMSSCVIELGVN